jgi:hypothetical protein
MHSNAVPVASTVGLLVALFGAALAFLQWRSVVAATQQNEAIQLTELRREWLALRRSWRLALMTVQGPGDYYNLTSVAEEDAYAAIASAFSRTDAAASDFRSSDWLNAHEELDKIRPELRPYRLARHDVVEFLDLVASMLLSGRVSLGSVYALLGGDLARRGAAIREMLQGPSDGEFRSSLDVLVLPRYHGRAERILTLLDLLWAESCRRLDLPLDELAAVSRHKHRARTGPQVRARCRRLSARMGLGRRKSRQLERLLVYSEVLPVLEDWRTDPAMPPRRRGTGVRGFVLREWVRLKYRRSVNDLVKRPAAPPASEW